MNCEIVQGDAVSIFVIDPSAILEFSIKKNSTSKPQSGPNYPLACLKIISVPMGLSSTIILYDDMHACFCCCLM
jgi:hypothetical protein